MALQWIAGLGWGAFLGWRNEGLGEFLIVTLSLGALWIWFERGRIEQFSQHHVRAFAVTYVGLALWMAAVMAAAYWPARVIRTISG